MLPATKFFVAHSSRRGLWGDGPFSELRPVQSTYARQSRERALLSWEGAPSLVGVKGHSGTKCDKRVLVGYKKLDTVVSGRLTARNNIGNRPGEGTSCIQDQVVLGPLRCPSNP
jgi:hypothetical protein